MPRSDSISFSPLLQTGARLFSARRIHRYHGKIYAFLFKLTGKREDAEDLTQDTLLLALRKLKTFKAGHQLLPWLFTIARRTAISQWRKSKPSVTLLDSDHPSTESDRPHDAIALWKIAKKSLNPNEFTALWMHYRKASAQGVARVLGKTAPRQSHPFRARKDSVTNYFHRRASPGQTVNLTSP